MKNVLKKDWFLFIIVAIGIVFFVLPFLINKDQTLLISALMSIGSSIIVGVLVSFAFLVVENNRNVVKFHQEQKNFIHRISNGVMNIQYEYPKFTNTTENKLPTDLEIYVDNLYDIMREYTLTNQVESYLNGKQEVNFYKKAMFYLKKSLRESTQWNQNLKKALDNILKVNCINLEISDEKIKNHLGICMVRKDNLEEYDRWLSSNGL